jgi:hypothetical protein
MVYFHTKITDFCLFGLFGLERFLESGEYFVLKNKTFLQWLAIDIYVFILVYFFGIQKHLETLDPNPNEI